MNRFVRTTTGLALAFSTPCVLAQPCNPGWVSKFPGGDFDGAIRASVVFNDGTGDSLYVAGSFSRAGGIHAQGVAKWTGTAWAPVGGHFNADVNALWVHTDGVLYAGGAFSSVSGTATPRVARWNGSAWVAIGSTPNLSGTVLAFASFPDAAGVSRLWATGLSLVNGSGATSAAMRWNDTTWSSTTPVGSSFFRGASFAVFTEQAVPRLFVGGASVDSGVRRWTGTDWQIVGFPNDPRGTVNAMVSFDDGTGPALFATGDFVQGGNHAAKWDGQAWSQAGAFLYTGVNSLQVFDPDGSGLRLFAGCKSAIISGTQRGGINYWDGVQWQPFALSNDSVLTMARLGSSLFAGGAFSVIEGVTASRAALLSPGSNWQPMANQNLGTAPASPVNCMAWFDDDGEGPHPSKLYVGGDFQRVGATSANYIAVWDGTSWSSLPQEFNGTVRSMTVLDDGSGPALYVAGTSYAASQSVVVRWNGSTWAGVGSLMSVPVQLGTFRTSGANLELYACGEYPNPAGIGTVGILRWNGSAWVTVGTLPTSTKMNAIQSFDDGSGPRLFASIDPGIGAARVYAWDGTNWTDTNASAASSSRFTALAVYDAGTGSALYALNELGGLFKWSGASWSLIPGGLNFTPKAAIVHDDGSGPALYAGGISGSNPSRLARWKGSGWTALAPSAQPNGAVGVQSLLSVDPDATGPAPSELFVGGFFNSIGGIDASNLAVWSACGCYPNCDQSVMLPLLNINDFQCFLNKFATQDPYANCDGSTTPPLLTAADFQCFLNRFAAGCN